MTVSPGWPQDGNGPPKAEDSGVDCDSIARPALPPTLFQLPSLEQPASTPIPSPDPAATGPVAKNNAPASETAASPDECLSPGGREVSAGTEHPVESTPQENLNVAAGSPSGSQPIDRDIRSSRSGSVPDQSSTNDEPASRAWMDSLSSHGVVIVLLLVVVAAALVTGRNRQGSDVESSLAEHSDLLDFDLGDEVELPIPDHGVSSFADADMRSRDAESSTQDSVDAAPYEMMIEKTVDDVADPSDQAVVSLDAPSLDKSTVEPSADLEPGTSRIKKNQFVSDSDRVDATAVSSRKPNASDGSLPSLKDLTDDPPAAVGETKHRRSTTPARMTNLLQYLPPKPGVGVDSVSGCFSREQRNRRRRDPKLLGINTRIDHEFDQSSIRQSICAPKSISTSC